MWTPEKSAKLSLVLTDFIFLLSIIIGIFLPFLAGRYIEITGKSQALKTVLVTVCYFCLPFVLILLLASDIC